MRGALRGWSVFAAAILLVLWHRPIAAQVWDPDWCLTCADTRLHAAAGALLDAGLQLPLAPRGFRDTMGKRMLLVAVIGFTYEVGQLSVAQSTGVAGQPGFGIGPKDLLADLTGAAAMEGLVAICKALLQ